MYAKRFETDKIQSLEGRKTHRCQLSVSERMEKIEAGDRHAKDDKRWK